MKTVLTKAKVLTMRLVVAALSILLPVSLATPAQASTTFGKCTVTPFIPAFAGLTSSGAHTVVFKVRATCEGLRDIAIEQRIYDTGPKATFLLHTRIFHASFFFPGTANFTTVIPLPDLQPDSEGMYQRVRFIVTSGVPGAWTPPESSPIRWMPN